MGIGRSFEILTRAGFAARGIMYFTIGFLALRSGRAEDGAGALELLQEDVGRTLLAAMAVGFLGYGLWRLSEAAIDTEGHGTNAKGLAVRAGGAVSGALHLGLCWIAATLALGAAGGGGDSADQGAATALGIPGGGALLAAAAAALAAVGLYQIVRAVKGGFLRHLDPRVASQSWVLWLGRGGYGARGIVFLVMGWFLWQAASETRASAAAGIGEALASLPETLRMGVAAGFLLFGLFSLVEARHRRINDTRIVERMKHTASA